MSTDPTPTAAEVAALVAQKRERLRTPTISAHDYLPDFFLPESKQHVEVKGVWRNRDFEKALALVTANEDREADPGWGYPLISCMPGGVFFGLRRMVQLGEVRLGLCGTCEAWYFFDEDAGWACRRCSARNLSEVLSSPLVTWKGAA